MLSLKLSKATCAFAVVAIVVGIAYAEDKHDSQTTQTGSSSAVSDAREQAKLLHGVYAATLETMHRPYFEANKSVLPARAMEDIFDSLKHESKIKANWISVNTRAMSVHHEPSTDFEKKAARELAKTGEAYEQIEEGFFYRAGPITLSSGCLKCHTSSFTGAVSGSKIAGLVIAIPLQSQEK